MSKTLEEKLNENRSYRNTRPFEIREQEDGKMAVEGYATVFNEAYEIGSWDGWDGYRVILLEKVDPSAFDKCDMKDVIMQYNHEGRVFARTSNGTLELATDQKGLKVFAQLQGTEIGRQLYEEIQGGYTTKMSFGFIVRKDKREEETDDENRIRTITRTITDISKLFDVSAVSIPANDATEISARSYADGVIAELQEEFRQVEEVKKKKIKILTEV